MGELITFNPEQLSNEELDLITTKAILIRQQRVEVALKEVRDAQKQVAAQIEILKEETEKTREIAVNKMRVTEPKYGWVNQGDFGRFFTVSISAVRMGKLLKVVGLAMKNKARTTPYREYIPNYATVQANDHYTDVKWNYESCINFIDKWLKANELYEKFYSIGSTKEMENFIDQLYEKIQ